MSLNTPEIRLSIMEPMCRLCGKSIPKATPMIHSRIVKNGDGNTYICPTCIVRAYNLMNEWEEHHGRV